MEIFLQTNINRCCLELNNDLKVLSSCLHPQGELGAQSESNCWFSISCIPQHRRYFSASVQISWWLLKARIDHAAHGFRQAQPPCFIHLYYSDLAVHLGSVLLKAPRPPPHRKCAKYYEGLVRIFCTFLRGGGPSKNVQNWHLWWSSTTLLYSTGVKVVGNTTVGQLGALYWSYWQLWSYPK